MSGALGVVLFLCESCQMQETLNTEPRPLHPSLHLDKARWGLPFLGVGVHPTCVSENQMPLHPNIG